MICFLLGLLGLALITVVVTLVGACCMRLSGSWPAAEEFGLAFAFGAILCMLVPLLVMVAYCVGCVMRHVL